MTILKMKFKYALIISFFLLLVSIIFSIGGVVDFYKYKLMIDPEMELNLTSFHFFLRNRLLHAWLSITAPSPQENSPLQTFYIHADRQDLAKLNANLPESGKTQYIDASMKIDDGKDYDIELRYRGDNYWHWFFDQKSLRIKINGATFNQEEKFNLIAPQAYKFRDKITFDFARKYGLIVPDYFPVRVFLNNKYMGVYVYVSQIDKIFLKKNKKMPGSIYDGDFSAPFDENMVNQLWFDEKYWEKNLSKNAKQKDNRDDIKLLIDAIVNFGDLEFYEFVNTFINKDAFYTYFAIDTLFGNGHHDFFHNNRLYFDPYLGKFEPIERDVIDWIAIPFKDYSVSPFFNRIKLNPILEFERDKVAYNLFKSMDFNIQNLTIQFLNYKNMLHRDRESDSYRGELVFIDQISTSPLVSPSNLDLHSAFDRIAALFKRQKVLQKIYDDASSVYNFSKSGGKYLLNFKVFGNSGIRFSLKEILNNFKGDIYRDKNFNGYLDEQDILIDGVDEIILPGRKIVPILSDGSRGNTELINSPLYYSYILDGDLVLEEDTLLVKNAVTDNDVKVAYEDFTIQNESDSIHPWKFPSHEKHNRILSGKIYVNENLVFDQYTNVTVAPDTTFVISPHKSLFFYGKLDAVGTEDEPIKFIAQDPLEPWGVVALQDAGANGSKLDYVEFSGGSIAQRNLIDYSGEFSIHGVDNFELSHCKFVDDPIGDATMHVVYGSGVIDNCIFLNAKNDALDVDMANIEVKGTIFNNSGKDAIRFNGSEPLIENSMFFNSKENCISVTESTTGTYFNNFLYGCNIGMNITDQSLVNLKNIFILNSKNAAIDISNQSSLYNNEGIMYMVDNKQNLKADKKSILKVGKIKNDYPDLKEFIFVKEKLGLSEEWGDNLEQKIYNFLMQYD